MDWAASTAVESLVIEARALWERARLVSGAPSVEIYLKQAQRWRLRRGSDPSDALESGTACRWQAGDRRSVSHVAIVGTDRSHLQGVIERAADAPSSDSRSLAVGKDFPAERTDFETHDTILNPGDLREWMARDHSVDSLEVGLTTEILVGAESWVGIRTRARSSALVGRHPRLVARRGLGFAGWPDRFEDTQENGELEVPLALEPEAAGPVVAALVHAFHLGSVTIGSEVGEGWQVTDDPLAVDGLAGGSFDDAGFPVSRRTLSAGGRILAGIEGPGTYWRRSFRDAPLSLPSTIVVGSERPAPAGATVVHSCRVIPLGRDRWVLEFPGDPTRFVQTDPGTLVRACRASFGPPAVTADGAVTPGLIFDGIVPL
jgi:hypothetical protein